MRRFFLMAAAVLTMALPQDAAPQAQTGASDLKIALFNLQRTLSFPHRDFGPWQPRLAAATQWLVSNYPRGKPTDVSQEYARSIQTAVELLNSHPSSGVVEDIVNDLEAKVEHCRRTGLGMGGSVMLKVNTRRGSASVADWQVLYLLKIYERVSGASPGNFPRMSTPTDMQLEPGRYWVWARNPSTGTLSDRLLVKVAGQKEVLVDLAVP